MGKMVGAAEFKAKCLKLIDELQSDGEPVTITKRGKPVAVLTPAESPRPRPKAQFGALRGSVTVAPDYDPSEPAYDGPWDAELGKWEPER
ncbi:MAG: type II toxin-antitoxin system Phd/YefM family antitoxin [Acetobacteraceae bacterium]|nr:type II toxin-antitoxin system Phd/YefM family antitoxin [Acetobacteraceae bacterium]